MPPLEPHQASLATTSSLLLVAAFLMAGCAEPAVPPAVPEPAPAVPIVEQVDWSATVTGWCVVATGGNFCMSGPGVTGGSNAEAEPIYVHDANDRGLESGELTLEWESNSLSTEILRLAVTAFSGCPDECEANRSLGSATGPSPLVVNIGPMHAPGLQVVARVEKVDFAPGLQASLGQPVHLGGALTFLEPAASEPHPNGLPTGA